MTEWALGAAPIEADYLVVGGGAMGMAFADEIIHGSKKARVVVVDRRAKPGGHWNDAYRFVTLDQPALYYGVNSVALGDHERDLVSQAQISAYYEKVVDKLERTGRFHFLPLCEYGTDERVRSIAADGHEVVIRAAKIVDATYMERRIPATSDPDFEIRGRARVVPINDLATLGRGYRRFVIVGAGKTGIDAALFLLRQGVGPGQITWIMPNDAWFLNREALFPGGLSEELEVRQEVVSTASGVTDAFRELEARGRVLRLDADRWPTKYRCATVTESELSALRRIEDIDRHGRLRAIDGASLEFGVLTRTLPEAVSDVLYVDCSNDGLTQRDGIPIWNGDRIVLQSVILCQQVLSSAVIAALDLKINEADEKNRILEPVPHPQHPAEFLQRMQTTIRNQDRMAPTLGLWMFQNRLSPLHHMKRLDVARMLARLRRYPAPSDERLRRAVDAG